MAKGKARRGKEAVLNIADFKTTDTENPAMNESWGGTTQNGSDARDTMALPTSSTHFVEEYRRNYEERVNLYIEAMKVNKEYRLSITKLPMDVTEAMIRKSLALDNNATVSITPSQHRRDETILSPMAQITFRDPEQFRSLAMDQNPIKVGNSVIMVKLMDRDIRHKQRMNRPSYTMGSEYSGSNMYSSSRKSFNKSSVKFELGTKYGTTEDKFVDNQNNHFRPRNREIRFGRFADNNLAPYNEASNSRKFVFGVVSQESSPQNRTKYSGSSSMTKPSTFSKSSLKFQFGTIDHDSSNSSHKHTPSNPEETRFTKSNNHPVFKLGTLCPPSQQEGQQKP